MSEANSNRLSPRHATSRQWTELPPEFAKKIREVFSAQFVQPTKLGEFIVEGRIYPEEVVVRIGYLEHGRLKQMNFEASMDLPIVPVAEVLEKEEDLGEAESLTMERLYICIDAIGSLMEEYFNLGEDEEMDVPLRWQAFEFERDTVYLQYSTLNSKLEDEADRLLGLSEKTLLHDDSASEDALAKAEIDSELAMEVQKLIRSGKYPGSIPEPGSDLN